MAGYQPLKITGMQTGLVQSREEFILPNDAYPTLENAYVWRERIKRKRGYQLLGRLRRILTAVSAGTVTFPPDTFNLFTQLSLLATQPNAEVQPGSVASPIIIIVGPQTLTDTLGIGTFVVTGAGTISSATINYATGIVTVVSSPAGPLAVTITMNYYPGLPVMGLRQRQLNDINNEQLVAFDQVYAYQFGATGWQEFIPGTTWSGSDSQFFWSTNYWVGDANLKIFWVTNFNAGASGDPIRYTNDVSWVDFAPTIDAVSTKLQQCLAMLPFRGRMVTFNTWEGTTMANAVNMRQRIRWAAIGTPFSDVAVGVVSTVNANAWRDDIRGQGGFLDIPTSEDIVAVGYVRDNLVIYCESSTWQLRYTGRSIAPFQIERVNSELGAGSTFSAVQFDTSLVGIGNKGVMECDSYKSARIDIKIPDLVFTFDQITNGPIRVHGIRDFQQELAYWTYPFQNSNPGLQVTFPNRRLCYNYENDSWAIFTDSLTTLGTYQKQTGRTWADQPSPAWQTCDFQWVSGAALFPFIVGGNQQGFVEYLDVLTSNDISLSITAITGRDTIATRITSPNHNLETDQVVEISQIPTGTPFANTLNGNVFGITVIDANTFDLYTYNSTTLDFTSPQLDPSANVYVGGGKIAIRDNFSVTSKKFNFMDNGEQIQMGYVDILLEGTSDGNITMNVYMNYNDSDPINTLYENEIGGSNPPEPDQFFNSVIPTNPMALETISDSTKNWQRIFCPTRAQFLTIEYTFSNEQMSDNNQQTKVQIDAQILWIRKAGRLI